MDVSDWMVMLKYKYIFLSSKSKDHFSLNSYTGDCQMHLFYDFLGPKMKSVILKQACGGFFQKLGTSNQHQLVEKRAGEGMFFHS